MPSGRIAIALGVLTCELGHRAYFTTAMDLARKLTRALHENRLHRELNGLIHKKLLILDGVGYLALDAAQSSLLFQVLGKRYERELATVLTSNKSFTEWGQVFGGEAVLPSAVLHRLLHRSTVANIRGDSYRLKDRRKAGGAGANEATKGS